MSRKVILLIILVALFNFANNLFGQQKTLNVATGISSTTFQDTKFSDVKFLGLGGNINTYYSRLTQKSFLKFGLIYINSKENPNTHQSTSNDSKYFGLNISYLKNVNSSLYIGLKASLLEFYIKIFENLNNNKTYYNIGSHLYFNLRYSPLNRLNLGLDIGIISYIVESNGFSFSYFQQILEEGKYQNQDLNNTGLGILKYGTFFHLFSGFQMGLNANWSLSQRFDVKYSWKVYRFAMVENYPVVRGFNDLTISYNIINRKKN